jgi:hypothetical protein
MMYLGIIFVTLGFITIISLFIAVIVQGCYIATMVYGSYDAPEVKVLRQYRDERLSPYFLGRLLIGIYYLFSPTFVYLFKQNKPVNRCIKFILDAWVARILSGHVRKLSGKEECWQKNMILDQHFHPSL